MSSYVKPVQEPEHESLTSSDESDSETDVVHEEEREPVTSTAESSGASAVRPMTSGDVSGASAPVEPAPKPVLAPVPAPLPAAESKPSPAEVVAKAKPDGGD